MALTIRSRDGRFVEDPAEGNIVEDLKQCDVRDVPQLMFNVAVI